MAVLCEFSKLSLLHEAQFYTCEIKNQIIPENKELKLIESFQTVKLNLDVHCIKFSNCTVTKVPSGLTKIFPNLKILIILSSKLKKLSKNDLNDYKNLMMFICEENEVEFLPADLFQGFINLEFISFSMNKLISIEPGIFDGLTNLKHVSFKNNPNYNKVYSIYTVYNANASLNDVNEQLFEKYYSKIENVKKMMQKYEQEIQMLKKSEEKLKSLESSSVTDSDYYKLINRLQTGIFGDLESYMLNESTKDFTIQVQNQQFKVHKFLLAARSSTLAEILQNNPKIESLNFVDISVEIFKIILKFLYTDELPSDDGTNWLHLFATAGKLKIEELKNYAGGKIFGQLNDENAFEILNQSNKYKIYELREKAFQEIKKKYPSVELKEDLMEEPEKLYKIVQNFKKKEEAKRKYEEEIRKLDEQFDCSMMD